MDSLLIDTLKGKVGKHPPVWFMRQAGRLLPGYRKLREKYTFQQLMSDPELAAMVTLMPVNDLGVDAAILFSDILVVPVAMGMELQWTDAGPRFLQPLAEVKNAASTLRPDEEKLNYIYAVIDRILQQRDRSTPLIGFCGGPFTTLCYMLQGVSSNGSFSKSVSYLYTHQQESQKLIDVITDFSILYAKRQIEHGIDAFQLFESNAGVLPWSLYCQLCLPSVRRIAAAVRDKGIPFLYFPKGIGTGLVDMTPDVCDFVSVDWQTPIEVARNLVHHSVGLQGNLDPRALLAPSDILVKELNHYKEFRHEYPNFVFNLGHGILPDTPLENVKKMVDWVKNTQW